MKITRSLLPLALFLIASSLVSLSQSQSASASSLTSAEQCFIPEESRPNFSDFKNGLYFRMRDFEKILPPFLSDSFKMSASGNSVSDHPINWEEITFFFNNVATQVGSKQANQLYVGEAAHYITRKVKGFFSNQRYYVYEANAETADQPAKLPLTTLQRYVNWRTVHAWLYQQLKAYGESLKQGTLYDANDELAQYFKKRHLWPIVDVVGSTVDPSDEMSDYRTDNIDAILEEATEVGTYWFAAEGTLSHVSKDKLYDLAIWKEGSSGDTSSEQDLEEENGDCYGLLIRSNPQTASQQSESDFDYLTQQQKAIDAAQKADDREELIDGVVTLAAGAALGVGEAELGSYIADQKIARTLEREAATAKRIAATTRVAEREEVEAAGQLLTHYKKNPSASFTQDELNTIKQYEFYQIATGASKRKPQDVEAYLLTEQEKGYADWICHDSGSSDAKKIKEQLTFRGTSHFLEKSKYYNRLYWH